MEPLEQSALALQAMLDSKQISAVEVMQATLARIDAVNGAVNAVVSLRDHDALMAEAAQADATPRRGPLHGVPMAIKDLADAKGLPTSMGSPVYKDAGPAPKDDIMVARMRAGYDILQEGGIRHPPAQYAAMIVAIEIRRRAIGVAPMRRLVADKATGACRNADRTADIGAGGDGRHSCGQSGRRPARRTAGAKFEVEWIARDPPEPGVAGARQAELWRGRAGMKNGPRFF